MRVSRIGVLLVWALCVCVVGPLMVPVVSQAASAQKINAAANNTIAEFRSKFSAGPTILRRAKGVLVFPEVIQAGVGIGGQYGEGVLRVGGKSVGYYSFTGGSIGLQLGAQRKSILIAFLQDGALRAFRQKAVAGQAWQVGGDASVALLTAGTEAALTSALDKPIVAYVFNQAGLMGSLSLEGAKITKIQR
jgi:lipid-binding SYLF domain-containing protein